MWNLDVQIFCTLSSSKYKAFCHLLLYSNIQIIRPKSDGPSSVEQVLLKTKKEPLLLHHSWEYDILNIRFFKYFADTPMNLLQFIPKALIYIILMAWVFAVKMFLDIADSTDLVVYYTFMITTFFVIFTAIVLVIHIFYDRPIRNLEFTIKKFLVGSLGEKDISFKKNLNPHLNYILLFFGKTLHTLRHIKTEFLHGKEIKWEVELASEIQDKLFRKKLPEIPDLEIIAKSKPAWEIGWDSFDVITEGDNHYIYVWDATGHWVGAGFIMMMVNALISGFAKATEKWHHVLALTNDIIKPRVKANLLMSMLLVRWNHKEKKLYMTWAGHEYLIIYKYAEKKCYKIRSGWVALGMTKNIHKLLKEQEVSFVPNDIIILYSDGITEAINRPIKDGAEEMFGEFNLIRAIEEAPEIWSHKIKTARSVFKNVSIHLSKFMWYKHTQLDDVTLITIQYKSSDYIREEDCSEELHDDFITEWKWN